MKEPCYLNGEIIPVSDAKISITDIGLWRGYGVYEGLSGVGKKVFRFDDHWDRFLKTSKRLGLKPPIEKSQCESIMEELLSKNRHKFSVIRMVLTGGDVVESLDFDPSKPTFTILIKEWQPLLPGKSEEGKIMIYEFKREMPEIKTINYIQAVSLQNMMREKQATEVLYCHHDKVLECATANIFLVKDGSLITPKDEILEGVTRKVVKEILKGKYEVEEKDIYKEELLNADEVFITSSFKPIKPIVKVDGRPIGSGKTGPVTEDVMSLFADYLLST